MHVANNYYSIFSYIFLQKDFEFQKHPVPVPRKNRQPSITEDSSSSAEEVDEVDDAASVSSEVVHERENKR